MAKIKQPSQQQAQRPLAGQGQPSVFRYLWDGNHLIEQQRCYADGSLAHTTQYVYEPNSFKPLAQLTQNHGKSRTNRHGGAETLMSELHYIVTDQAGTPRELCSENGDIEWRGEQGLWSEHHKWRLSVQHKSKHRKYLEDAANDPVDCDLRYQGQIYDQETGLYYNRHRYYDPDSCQYLTPDPIGMAGGIRPQAYVHNPMEWVDPLGLTSCELSSAMEKNGTPRPDNSAAHHIVGETSKGAQPARDILDKHNIDINGTDNGVFLPNKNNTDGMQGILHNGRHPDKYLESVNARIIDADRVGGKEAVLGELSSIKNTLSSANNNTSWYTILN